MGWRDRILAEFVPGLARLTLVADPDGLLAEEGMLQAIRARGFEIVPFEDSIAFRYAYEAGCRARWERGEGVELVVVVRGDATALQALPYDLLQAGRPLSFGLGELFPALSYPVVATLDRADLDLLDAALAQHRPQALSENASKDFVLRHVFAIAPETIEQPAELLRVLLRRHYPGRRVPAEIDAHLVQRLRQGGRFAGWPLEAIVPDRTAFFAFLQERWPLFLDRLLCGDTQPVHEAGTGGDLRYPGPALLPFEQEDVRVYVDNLFYDGLLRPVPHRKAGALRGHWAAVGLRIDPAADRARRLAGLLRALGESLPSAHAHHSEWLSFALRWAELAVLQHQVAQATAAAGLYDLEREVDARFLTWVLARYGGLHNQPPQPPVMVHHVARAMAHAVEAAPHGRAALVVLDGCALDQWAVLRAVLARQRPRLVLREGALFAWLPTITAVSRQAAFAARPPLYFPDSLHTTDREPALWQQFWADRGLAAGEVVYARGLGDGSSLQAAAELLSPPKVRVAGLVVDTIDRITGGMQLGAAGMHNQVRQWAEQGYVADLLDLLLARGYAVSLIADHGNIEAIGCGRPREGAVADLRGERARVYPSAELRAQVHEACPEAIAWPPLGLPPHYLALLAPARRAFVGVGERVVAHGGLSIEELIVPYVRIESPVI